jgi:predicted ATPase
VVAELPQGTVTFLFTDIEGSTRLLHELGPTAYAEALAEHRRRLRDAFASHGGVEVDTQGDAFFVAFPTAPGAVAAADEGQAALEAGPICVRMGVHTGTPTVTAEGYVGVDVHRGARVAALAHGGQVLLTEATAQLLDAQLTDLGRHRLKDFDGPARLLQLGTATFPPLRTPGTVDLPTPATRFLGRDHELFDGVALVLEHDPAILTILGPGGIGKTRFAIELGRLLAEDAEGGTVFLPLAPLRDPSLVLAAIATRLGSESPEPSTIAARLGQRRTLIVLDNLEHLLPGAAAPLASLVDAAPSLRLLVTSREALQVRAETRFDLPPLSLAEATELFLRRSQAVGSELTTSPTIETLCEQLDRLPLALELAAARTRVLAPEALLERLGSRLDLPALRDADTRHATLRATIAWSYDLLDEPEQALFARLSTFVAGCTLESAEAVCDADLEILASLLDKSLVRRRTGALSEERFWMLETIRAFAAERLLAHPEEPNLTVRRHAVRMLELARAANLTDVQISTGDQRHELILAEREDVRAALDWATANDRELATELVVALEQFWVTHALGEGLRRTDELLSHDGSLSPRLRAALLRLHGSLTLLFGDVARGDASYTEALALYRELEDGPAVAVLLTRFAGHAGHRGDAEEARRLIDEARSAITTHSFFPRLEAQHLSTLGALAEHEGDLRSAMDLYRQSSHAAEECGFRMWHMWMLGEIADLSLRLGLVDDARRAWAEALREATAIEDRRITRLSLLGLAKAARAQHDLPQAGLVWGWVAEEERIEPLLTGHAPYREYVSELAQERRPGFLAGVEAGATLSREDVVELAIAQTEP